MPTTAATQRATKNGQTNTLKMLAISMSWDCIKIPRCSFCYLVTMRDIPELVLRRLKGIPDEAVSSWDFKFKKELEKYDSYCFEYNGYNLTMLEAYCSVDSTGKRKPSTMTTMPQTVTPILAGYLKSLGIRGVALSYDSEKVPEPGLWVCRAKMLKNAGIPVSCNYLIEPKIGLRVPEIVLKTADQLNLLSFKPTGKLSEEGKIRLCGAIWGLKSYLPVVLDNCLGYQLGYIDSCEAGESFDHMMPDGTITSCCFKNKCFLWREGGKAN